MASFSPPRRLVYFCWLPTARQVRAQRGTRPEKHSSAPLRLRQGLLILRPCPLPGFYRHAPTSAETMSHRPYLRPRMPRKDCQFDLEGEPASSPGFHSPCLGCQLSIPEPVTIDLER